jgi:hypothetical protein
VSEYVLDHHQEGERQRLALMSRLLDPMHRRHIERLGAGPGARTLEVGCGNGSISGWLAARIAPGGRAVAVDLDLSLVEADGPGLELRQADILAGPVEPGDFDLVTARAVLHHVADADAAVRNLVASVRPGGAILLIEPDSCRSASPSRLRSGRSGRDGWPGRAGRGSTTSSAAGCRRCCLAWGCGTSGLRQRLRYITVGLPGPCTGGQTVIELRAGLVASGEPDDRLIDTFLAQCTDPAWWTQTIAFTAVGGRAPGG